MRRITPVPPLAHGWRVALRLLLLLATAAALAGADPAGAAAPESAPLARYFPRADLVVYAEFDGLEAHAESWKKTAAYRLLHETTTGAMLEAVLTQLGDRAPGPGPARSLTGAELMTITRHAARAGFALGIVRPPGERKPSCVGLVLRGAARGEVRDLVGRLIDADPGARPHTEAVTKPGDRRVLVVGDPRGGGFAWWSEGEDLAFSLAGPAGADAMIAALDGRVPDAAEHPTRAALARAEDGFESVGRAFFDMAALPELPPRAATLGLDRVRRVDYRWGFQDEALMSVVRLVAPAPRAGILALLDQPTFRPKDLPPRPSGLTSFTALALDPLRLYDRMAALARATDPDAPARFRALEEAVREVTGRRLREDLLGHLGPRMVLSTVPTRIDAPANPLAGLALGLVHVPRTTLVVEIDDPEAVGRILDDLVARANRAFRAPGRRDDRAPTAEFRPLKGHNPGYTLALPPAVATLPAGMRPTVLVGKTTLVLGTTPEAARAALDPPGPPGGPPADDALARTLGHLPDHVTLLTVSDPRRSLLPELIANLPNLVQLVGSGSVPRLPFLRGRGPSGREFRIEIDPDEIPAPDDLRPFLFPATYALAVDDQGFRFVSREAFPALNPTTAAPAAVALLLPAVQASRAAARRSQSVNNLKQMGLALHNYHDANAHFPPGAIRDREGKPLLSWRVAILPFLEQQALFQEFQLDEPWDSPRNKALLERMPAVYAVPNARAEPGMTFYRGFSGPTTLFDDAAKDGVGIRDILDGTSTTLAIVEAREAVPWTKPDAEIPFDADARPKPGELDPLPSQLGGHFQGGFDALFLDGSVRFLSQSVNTTLLRALITRDAGEVVSSDQF